MLIAWTDGSILKSLANIFAGSIFEVGDGSCLFLAEFLGLSDILDKAFSMYFLVCFRYLRSLSWCHILFSSLKSNIFLELITLPW